MLYETPGVDPKTLPDAYTEIPGGHAALYNGWLIGLVHYFPLITFDERIRLKRCSNIPLQSSIHRSADATLDYAGRFITFNGSAGYSNMQVNRLVFVLLQSCRPSSSVVSVSVSTRRFLIMALAFRPHAGRLSLSSRGVGNRTRRRGLRPHPKRRLFLLFQN